MQTFILNGLVTELTFEETFILYGLVSTELTKPYKMKFCKAHMHRDTDRERERQRETQTERETDRERERREMTECI